MRGKIHFITKTAFSIFMLVSAFGELIRDEAVVASMITLDLPLYLLDILGFAKLLGVIGIWLPFQRIREWAYAGFVFDLIGALCCFIYLGIYQLPDIFLSPLAIILCLVSYYTTKEETTSNQFQKLIKTASS